MDIIKVDAIGSTNTFLKQMKRDKQIEGPICVVADKQFEGKGQRGATWQSNPGENLTCSVFMPINNMELMDQFYVSMLVSLAIYDTLDMFNLPKLSVKWPNDILSDRYKICGVLIENILNNGRIGAAIIGIGININQLYFDNLPSASSMRGVLGRNFDLDEVLQMLLSKLTHRFTTLNTFNFSTIKIAYENLLFRKNKPSTFLDVKGDSFVGIIQGVNTYGKLQVLLEDEAIEDFDLKELKLLY